MALQELTADVVIEGPRGNNRVVTRLTCVTLGDLADVLRLFDASSTSELARIEQKLDRVISLLKTVVQKEIDMSVEFDRLKASVTAATTVEQSGIVLLQGLSQQFDELIAKLAATGADTAELQALADQVDTNAAALSAALVANVRPKPQ